MFREKEKPGTRKRPPGPAIATPAVSTIALLEAVKLACNKDRSAFEVLYEYFKEPLGKRLLYLIGDKEAAYELYQETFIRFWTSLPLQPPPLNFEAWLYRIARNLAFDYLRHTKKLAFLSLTEGEQDEPGEYLLSGLLSETGHEERVCELMCIKQALAAMSQQYRVCVLLQDLWGYSQCEIAVSLRISESAVSANVSRGHRQLRTAYWDMMNAQTTRRKGE